MTDADKLPFLRAIVNSPDDDLPRLVYADFLEEKGEADHAVFIRQQCWGVPHQHPHYQGAKCSYHQHRMFEKRLGWVADINKLLREIGEGGIGQKNFGRYSWNEEKDGSIWMEIGDDARFTIRRGFVSEIRLPLAAFLGGQCERCGEMHPFDRYELRTCPDCHGTGHRPGLGRIIAEREPVEKWVLTGAEPIMLNTSPNDQLVFQDRYCWYPWRLAEGGTDAEDLPGRLFDLLPHEGAFFDGEFLCFPTREAALDALAEACWLYANRPRIEAEAEVEHCDRDSGFDPWNLHVPDDPLRRRSKAWFPTEAAAREAYFHAYCRQRAEVKRTGAST